MVAVKIFVESGGNRRDLQIRCRNGFSKLLESVMPKRGQLTIIACGSRDEAYKSFKIASENRDSETVYLLLVDAEEVVARNVGPWEHLSTRGAHWRCPEGVGDDFVHFMSVMTETWLVADPSALTAYYGNSFKESALPTTDNLEDVSKRDVIPPYSWSGKHSRKNSASIRA